MSSALDRLGPSLRRIGLFVLVGVVVYVLFVAAARLLYPSTGAIGPTYALSSVVAGGIAAYYLVYLGGFARLRDLLG